MKMIRYTIYILTTVVAVCACFSVQAKKQPSSPLFNRIGTQQQTASATEGKPQVEAPRAGAPEAMAGVDANQANRIVELVVNYGQYAEGNNGKTDTIVILLYPDANLSQATKQLELMMKTHAYDGILFHRVINNFMIQTGDPASKDALPGQPLGSGGVEGPGIKPMPYAPGQMFADTPRLHKYGAVAIARTGDQFNLARDGSTSQFYIVTDSTHYTPQQINQMAYGRRNNFQQLLTAMIQNPDSTQRIPFEKAKNLFDTYYSVNKTEIPAVVYETYQRYGGAPYLDEDYTVVGEVIKGMNAVQAIQHLPTDSQDRPLGFARIVSTTSYPASPKNPETPKPIRAGDNK